MAEQNQGGGTGSKAALLLIDVINHFEFADGESTREQALLIRDNLRTLKQRARAAGVPVIYVNDNFGDWRSEKSKLVERCLRPGARSAEFVQAIQPTADDYFVLKPMHSGFYETSLKTLLDHLGVSSLILAGLATNSCIVCTAHDANMRRYDLFVPRDCSAARSIEEHEQAIEHVAAMAKANTAASSELDLEEMKRGGEGSCRPAMRTAAQ